MLKNEREQEIINILREKTGFVTVRYLSEKLYASESSIRRDLAYLENKGVLKRSYGGAELIASFTKVIAFNTRAHHNTDAKRIIAKKAVSLIKDGDIVFLDQSSSSFYVAVELLDKKTLTVVTNNIEIASLLSRTEITVIVSGGTLSSNNRNCLVGADTADTFENIFADILFFSAKSLSSDGIISDCMREEVVVRNVMIRNSDKKVFLCDSEKFDTHSAYKQCTLKEMDYLISESDVAKKFTICSDKLRII